MFSDRVRQNAYIRYIVCIMVFMGILGNLVGCEIRKKEADKSNSEKCTLYEQEVDLPEGYSTVININNDGNKLYAVLGNDTVQDIYILENNKWDLYMDLGEIIDLSNDSCIYAVVSNEGEVFAQCTDKYYVIDKEKKLKEISIELAPVKDDEKAEWAEIFNTDVDSINNTVIWATFRKDKLFVGDLNGYIYKYDESHTLVYKSEKDMEQVKDISIDGNNLLVLYANGIAAYDVESAKEVDVNITNEIAEIITSNNSPSYCMNNEENNGDTYFECAGKIYVKKDNKMELDISLCGSNANGICMGFTLVDKENIYTVCADEKTYNNKLFYYGSSIPETKTEENTKKLSGDLRIWTLKESLDVNNLVNAFNEKNPSVKITVDVGCTGNNGITKSDAIKNLNAELLAGNGPDVIILDQLSIDNYIDNGYLLDLSDTVADIERDNNVFSNIIRGTENDKGIYGLPSRFILLGQTGTKGQMENSSDIQSWINSLEDKENKELIIPHQIEVIIQNMYFANKDTWINSNGVEKEKIDEFVTCMEKLCTCTGREALNFNSAATDLGISVDYYEVGCGKYQISYDYIVSYAYQIQGMKAVANRIGGEWKFPAGGFDGTYIPTGIIGINSKSNNVEASKELVKTLFDVSTMSMPSGSGIPANIDAMKMEITTDTDIYEPETEYELEYADGVVFKFPGFTDADMSEAIKRIDKLDKPIFRDDILMEDVFGVLEERVRGNLAHEETVDSICNKVMLHYFEEE